MTLAEAGKRLGITPEAVIYRVKTGKVKGHKIAGPGHGRWNITSLGNGSKNMSAKPVEQNGHVRDGLIVDAARRFPSLQPEQVLEVVDWFSVGK